MSKEILADDFLFGGVEANDATLSVFDKTTTNNDGIYRPSLKDAKDKKIGYRATLRFLPPTLRLSSSAPSFQNYYMVYQSGILSFATKAL